MATTVVYNGVTLYNVVTKQWDQEVTYDLSGTDLVGQKLKLQFEGILHSQRVPVEGSAVYISDGSLGGDLYGLLGQVRQLLSEPRNRLQVIVNGKTVIDVLPPSSGESESAGQAANADIDNGPKPKVISVTPIGSTAFRVMFSVEAMLGSCGSKVRVGEGLVVSNRWRVSEAMDSNFFTTRNISGRLRLSRAPQKPGDTRAGHYFKPLVIPPLEDSFRRDRVVFNAEEDGLTCTYEISDKQVHQAAPWPATKIVAVHSETVNNSTHFTSNLSVHLEGDPGCNKRLLIERAIQVADSRLNFIAITGRGAMVEDFTLTDHIGELPVVELRMRVRRVDAGTKGLLLGLRTAELGRDLKLPGLATTLGGIAGSDYNSQRSRVPKPYGYKAGSSLPDWERRPAVIYLLQSYLQNPCSGPHSVGPRTETFADRSAYSQEDSYRATAVSESDYPISQDDRDSYSKETKTHLYTMAKLSSKYTENRMQISLPRTSGKDGEATSTVVQIARPQYRRIVQIDYERVGKMPVIPEFETYFLQANQGRRNNRGSDSTPPVAIPNESQETILAPIRSPDGRDVVYRVRAEYVYLLTGRPDRDNLSVGHNPVTAFANYDGQLQLTDQENPSQGNS